MADLHIRSMFLFGLMCVSATCYSETLTLKFDAALNDHKSHSRMEFELELYRQFPRYVKGDQQLKLVPIHRDMTPARALQELGKGTHINVLAVPARADDPIEEIIIPVPIMKGLLGFRQLVVHRDTQKELGSVASVEDLKQFTLGQGEGWAEVSLYRANEFSLIQGVDLSSLFKMVNRKRFDILPLGVVESNQEVGMRPYRELVVYPDLLLYYPLPVTLYVHHREPELAKFLTYAMEKMLVDGTLDNLLYKHFSDALQAIRSPKQKILALTNQNIPKEIPLSRKDFWIH